MKVKAAIAHKAGAPLVIEDVDLDGPSSGEVLVEIKATGICHTDAFTLSGDDPEGRFPAILGHEGAGIVVETGKGVTSLKPGDILFLVGAAFSLAASAFFPPLVMGVFWKRANKWGAIVGMLAGLSVCMYYMLRTYPFFTNMGVPKLDLWWGLNPISAGMIGLPVGLVTIWIVSLLTAPPSREVQELVEHVRYPNLKGDTRTAAA